MKTYLHILMIFLFLTGSCCASSASPFDTEGMHEIPVLYKGRIRPMEVYARLWLDEIYHKESLLPSESKEFGLTSTVDFLWKLHFFGHKPWDDLRLFWIESHELKELLALNPEEYRFSFSQLQQAIYDEPSSNLALVRQLILSSYFEGSSAARKELSQLAPGLWVINDGEIRVAAVPQGALWKHLQPNLSLGAAAPISKTTVDEALKVISTLQSYSGFTGAPATELQARLLELSHFLCIIPCKRPQGLWVNPDALLFLPSGNFTIYPANSFKSIADSYKQLKTAVHAMYAPAEKGLLLIPAENAMPLAIAFSKQLAEGYETLSGKNQLAVSGKSLPYPSMIQLKMEALSYKWPLIEVALTAYLIAFVALLAKKKWGILFLLAGFTVQTAAIAIRCFVLGRPPVTNMFESVIYVPWIAVLASLLLRLIWKNNYLLVASSAAACLILLILHFTKINRSMENVQAVLDSQYWLIVHVLMVVGSYGVYLLAAALGHIYLAASIFSRTSPSWMDTVAKLILQTMYIGTALLIPGTILGGIWAAESWGRFWDWDPKEAWAFISSCVYLIWIHAYRFGLIRQFGLAVGAVVGIMAISFTWYGVNYILGTGLHSYGFGSGGERFYYLFLLVEIAFIAIAWGKRKQLPAHGT